MEPVGGEESSTGYARGLQEGRHYLRRRPDGPDVHEGLIDNLYGPYASSLRRFIDQRGWDTDLLTDERDPALRWVIGQPGSGVVPPPQKRHTISPATCHTALMISRKPPAPEKICPDTRKYPPVTYPSKGERSTRDVPSNGVGSDMGPSRTGSILSDEDATNIL